MEMDFDVSCKHKEDVQLHYVLLPRVLPQEKGDLYQVEHDLMTLFVRNVEDIAASLPSKTVKLFQSLQKVHKVRTSVIVSTEIKALGPGDTFAMFVRFQHSMIVIYVPSDENLDDIKNAIVATIPGSLHPDEVYGGNQIDLEVRLSRYFISQWFEIAHKMINILSTVQLSATSDQSEVLGNAAIRRFCKSTLCLIRRFANRTAKP